MSIIKNIFNLFKNDETIIFDINKGYLAYNAKGSGLVIEQEYYFCQKKTFIDTKYHYVDDQIERNIRTEDGYTVFRDKGVIKYFIRKNKLYKK